MSKVETFLSHHGVKGMKWGVRKPRGSSDTSSSMKSGFRRNAIVPPKKISTDAKSAAKTKSKLDEHGIQSLTNKEIADLNRRLNLEAQLKTLNPSKLKAGQNAVAQILSLGNTMNQAISFANSPAGKALRTALR